MEISRIKWPAQRELALDKGTRDALAELARRLWPHHTAKLAAREWDLTVDEARGVVAGRSSLTTYDKIIKKGGLGVALPVAEIVTGQSIASYFAKMREANDEHSIRFAAVFSSLLPLPADRGGRPGGGPGPLAGLRRSVGDREAGVESQRSAEPVSFRGNTNP